MRELRGLERGQVSLGVNESSIHALLPALARYRELHPGIHIRVHRVFSRDVPREVLSHHLDIGVISYIPEETELSAVEFYRDKLTVVVWPGHRLAKRREVDITDLGEETFIGHIVESPHRQRVVQLFARHHVPLHMDIEMPTIESIKLFVEMKKGIAIVPRMCVGPGDSSRNAAGVIDAANADSAAPLSRLPPGQAAHSRGAGNAQYPDRKINKQNSGRQTIFFSIVKFR